MVANPISALKISFQYFVARDFLYSPLCFLHALIDLPEMHSFRRQKSLAPLEHSDFNQLMLTRWTKHLHQLGLQMALRLIMVTALTMIAN